MEVKINECDNCGKITKDYHKEIGWIRIESNSNINIRLMQGRDFEGTAGSRSKDSGMLLDICNQKCLIEFLNKI